MSVPRIVMRVSVVFRIATGMINKIQLARLVVVIRQKKLDGSQLSESEKSRAARATSSDSLCGICTTVLAQALVVN
jgi:hypothetical protein